MSWDLFFVMPRQRGPSAADVLTYLRSTGVFQLSTDQADADTFEAVYDNLLLTKVHLELSYSRPTAPDSGDEGFVNSGLSANLKYVRPSFFAHEAMPLFEQLARSLDLRVEDPQDESADGPIVADAQRLIASWEHANELAVRSVIHQGAKLGYMPRERALAWWRTMQEFGLFGERLEQRLGTADLFIPTPLPALRAGDIEVYRTSILNPGVAQVLPECEYFDVLRPRRHRFMPWREDPQQEPEHGWLAAERVLTILGERLEPLPGSPDHHLVLPEARATETRNLFNKEQLEPQSTFRSVSLQAVVDVDFRAGLAA